MPGRPGCSPAVEHVTVSTWLAWPVMLLLLDQSIPAHGGMQSSLSGTIGAPFRSRSMAAEGAFGSVLFITIVVLFVVSVPVIFTPLTPGWLLDRVIVLHAIPVAVAIWAVWVIASASSRQSAGATA
jgi:hypothetical protein